MSLTIQILKDEATPAVQRLARTLASPEIRDVIGRAGRNVVKAHLEKLDRSRHRAHVAHHFYGRAARATSYRVTGQGAVVAIAQEGIAQRYYGGTIRPRRRRMLAIPARPEAEGKTPREFPDLFPVRKKTGFGGRQARGFLARREGRRIRIMFWLRRSVTQQPDPRVLPTDDELGQGIEPPLLSFVDRITARGN